MSKTPTLTYFPSHGRAFTIRAALRYAKYPFVDNRIPFAVFKEEWKPNADKTPLGSLPVIDLNDDGVYCQSLAIARWAARKSDLWPKDDLKILQADELIETIGELSLKAPQNPDAEVKKKLREEFAQTAMPKVYSFVAKRLEQNGGPFLLGKQISLPDLLLFSQVDAITVGDWDYIPSDFVEKGYPSIFALYKTLKEHPIIKAELEAKH